MVNYIDNGNVDIHFSAVTGLPHEYRCNDERYDGAAGVVGYIAKCGDVEVTGVAQLISQKIQNQLAVFNYAYFFDNHQAGIFSLEYRLQERSLLIQFGVVEEIEASLIEAILPDLIRCRQNSGMKFVHNNHRGGYISDVGDVDDLFMPQDDGRWGGYPNASMFPIFVLLQEKSFCVLEVQGYVCHTSVHVEEGWLSLGVNAPYQIRGGANTPDLPVNQKEICKIDFGGDEDGNGVVNWLDAAKVVRQNMPKLTTDYFNDKIFLILRNSLGRKQAEITFEQTELYIKRMYNLTDGAPQIICMTGWSQGGHDTSYPNIYTMNPELGTLENYLSVKKRSKELYNANLTLNDNFDDQYINEFTRDSYFKEQYIQRTRDNELETFEVWNGVDKSYITGFAKYMEDGGDGIRRIKHEVEVYQVEYAMLIDAMSWWDIRHNWNPECPASAVDNLVHGKFKAIDIFKKQYSVSIVSELLRYPIIGKLAMVCDSPIGYDKPSSKDIPFLRVALRDSIIYGSSGGRSSYPEETLYHSAIVHPWVVSGDSDEKLADIYYLNYLPWFLFRNEDLIDYSNIELVCTLTLEHGKIVIDYNKNTWYADYEGNRIITNNNISCPISDNKIAFYSKDGIKLRYRCKSSTSILNCFRLTGEGKSPFPAVIEKGEIVVDCLPNQPVIVCIG